jgi:hypothetical protein
MTGFGRSALRGADARSTQGRSGEARPGVRDADQATTSGTEVKAVRDVVGWVHEDPRRADPGMPLARIQRGRQRLE